MRPTLHCFATSPCPILRCFNGDENLTENLKRPTLSKPMDRGGRSFRDGFPLAGEAGLLLPLAPRPDLLRRGRSMKYQISVLIFMKDDAGRFLLLRRAKNPNKGLWSPIGGKLEMAIGESPYECALREAREETATILEADDLRLFCMAAEKAYEGKGHWLMFLFKCLKPLEGMPPAIDEGEFGFFTREEIDSLPIPATDREGLWEIYDRHHNRFVALKVDCHPDKPLKFEIEELIPAQSPALS